MTEELEVKDRLGWLDLMISVLHQDCCCRVGDECCETSDTQCPRYTQTSYHGSCTPSKGGSSYSRAGGTDSIGNASVPMELLTKDRRTRNDEETNSAAHHETLGEVQMPDRGSKRSDNVAATLYSSS
jgi:hypothetical protein